MKSNLIALTIAVLTLSVSVSADTYSTSIGGTKTTEFKKYLVVEKNASVPDAEFNFSIANGEAYHDETYQVNAGVDADKVTMTGVDSANAFAIGFSKSDSAVTTANALVKDYTSNDKYVEKTGVLDFSACTFTGPGIYRYVLSETSSKTGIVNDPITRRFIDVKVADITTESDTENKLGITEYILHSDTAHGSENDAKGSGFTNWFDTIDLSLQAKTSGSQGDKNKYFEYKFTVHDAVPGSVLNVDLSNASSVVPASSGTTKPEYVNKTNPTSIVIGDDGSATVILYIKADEEVKIQGISAGTSYRLTEETEGYLVVNGEDEGTAFRKTGTVTPPDGKTRCDDVKLVCENKMESSISTGISSEAMPFIIAAILATIGIVLISVKKRKEII